MMMDQLSFIVALVGAAVTLVGVLTPVLILRMQQRAAAAVTKAETAATLAATNAATAARVAALTSGKVDEVHEQLDGRLTEFFAQAARQSAALERRIDEAFERGRVIGGEEMTNTKVTQSQERIEGHLEKQDAIAAERHEEIKNGSTTKGEKPA